jgi:Uma2 family endonuclease
MSSCEVILPTTTIHVPEGGWTLASFRAWAHSDECPEQARVTFLDGKVSIDMSPEEFQHHTHVKSEIARALMNLNRETRQGVYVGDGVLMTNVDAEVSTVPDGCFVLATTLRSGRARLVPRAGASDEFIEVEGTPDIVIEIVSKSSTRKDTERLLEKYHQAGIPEYWLVQPRGARIDFKILRSDRDGYESAAGRGGWQASRVLERQFRLRRERNELGLWEYTLDVRAK